VGGGVLVASLRLERLDSHDIGERALSLGVFTSPIVSMAPVGEGYHYVLVLPALVVAFWWALREGASACSWCVLGASTLLLTIPLHYFAAPSFQSGWRAIFAYPRVFAAFGLWGWLGLALARRQPSLGAPSSTTPPTISADAGRPA
jgi:hypothetical protein